MDTRIRSARPVVLPAERFATLIEVLLDRFDAVIAPTIEDGVIRLRPVDDADALPDGITDATGPGTYRLVAARAGRRFAYTVGPDSLKAVVHPSRTTVWTVRRRGRALAIDQPDARSDSVAVVGARACDLRARSIIGRTQTGGPHVDPAFAARDARLFVVAIDCTHPAPTCHCDTGHDRHVVSTGADVALTEFEHRDTILYLVRPMTDAGHDLVGHLPVRPATEDEIGDARGELDDAAGRAGAPIPTDARDRVADPEHPRWDDVAARCLACGNCTAVCPTCFCTDLVDTVSLDGRSSSRDRVWDTCFSLEYSHLGPGPHRASIRSRYRQWLTHKVGTWHDQFGESGCVGCGRCVVWCPVGIDLTEELAALGGDREGTP